MAMDIIVPVIIALGCLTAMALTVVCIRRIVSTWSWGRRMTRKPNLTPEMERMILNAWEACWSIERIRNHLRETSGNWIIDPSIYNAISRARKRGDKRATPRHTDMVVSSS